MRYALHNKRQLLLSCAFNRVGGGVFDRDNYSKYGLLSFRDTILKGHSHAILVHFKNKKICPHINERPQIMVEFCYQRLYYSPETIFCRLLLRMARMEMDCNLKKLG